MCHLKDRPRRLFQYNSSAENTGFSPLSLRSTRPLRFICKDSLFLRELFRFLMKAVSLTCSFRVSHIQKLGIDKLKEGLLQVSRVLQAGCKDCLPSIDAVDIPYCRSLPIPLWYLWDSEVDIIGKSALTISGGSDGSISSLSCTPASWS